MGTSLSKDRRLTGLVDGKKVEFTYSHAPSGERRLQYQTSKGEATTLEGANILGAFPVQGKSKGDYTIAFVQGSEQSPATKADQSIPKFETVVARNLPEEFIQDFQVGEFLSKIKNIATQGHPLHVIVSTKSGTGLATDFFNKAVHHALGYAGLGKADYVVHFTESATTVTELTEKKFLPRAQEPAPQGILILSGDGGIVDILNGLQSTENSSPTKYVPPMVSIIPMGTGNALAHSTKLTDDNTLGLGSLVRGRLRKLPTFKATFSPGAQLLTDEANTEVELPTDSVTSFPTLHGAVVCSWGMHAGLVGDSDTTEYRKFGVERFKMAAKEALYPSDGSPPHAYKAKVSMLKRDGATGQEQWQSLTREEHEYVLATMVSNLEKNFMISPESKPLDGKLRLVHFGPMSGDEVMRIMGLAYQNGKHVEDEAVGYEDIEGLRIEFEGNEEDARWRRICVDGKIVRVENDGWVEVRKESKHVLDVVCMA